jgi:hypothetical protein
LLSASGPSVLDLEQAKKDAESAKKQAAEQEEKAKALAGDNAGWILFLAACRRCFGRRII